MNRSALYLRRTFGREAIKVLLRPMLSWRPLRDPDPGFSIVLGVPWDLRHLLPVNLRFIARTDLKELCRVHVVFDRVQRRRADAEDVIREAREQFPSLPMTFRYHNPVSGRIIERVNVSTFYNSMNTVLALGECTSRYAVLHDFDLFPLAPEYFTRIVGAMRSRGLRFSGHELTHFDGLTDEDNLIGTWSLGIDVPWLREHYRPVDCFHKVAEVNGRLVNLDPYSWIQTRTPQRGLAGPLSEGLFCHVQNLCSTYLRFRAGRRPKVAWRLHYLWYLESLCGHPANFERALRAMEETTNSELNVSGTVCDFQGVHPTCANVLESELRRMETALFGACRPEVEAYVGAFREFLNHSNAVPAVVAAEAVRAD